MLKPIYAPHISPIAQRMVELIGYPATLKLVEAWGGRSWPFSHNRSNAGHARFAALAEIIGTEHAQTLTRHWGGQRIAIPKLTAALRAQRNQQLKHVFDQLTAQGESAQEATAQLALRFEVTERHVWRILKQPDPSPAPVVQGALF